MANEPSSSAPSKESIINDVNKVLSGEMSPSDIVFYFVMTFIWVTYLWETYLDHRQRRIYKNQVKIPSNAAGVMDDETYTKSRLYSLDNSNYGFWKGLYSQIYATLVLVFNLIPWLWDLCLQHGILLGFTANNEITISVIFIIYSTLFSFVMDIPWSYYKTFVIEERHGFNKQTTIFFIKDKCKQLLLTLLLSVPITAGLLWIIKMGGTYFYVYAWFFTLVVTLFFMFVYPNWIAPIFDRYEPLPEGTLKTSIEVLANSIDFPLTKLLVVEGSKRSSHSNAYFYGFWKNKRIVLFDTLMEGFVFPKKQGETDEIAEESKEEKPKQETNEKGEPKAKGCKDEEVLAVLCHELGHWKLNHVNFNLLIQNVNIFFMFFLFGKLLNTEVLFVGFGFNGPNVPLLIRLIIIFQFIFSPYNEITRFLLTLLSRHFEFQADNFSVRMKRGDKLASGLIKLLADNLSFPVNDWLYSSYNFSHPPLLERLAAIRADSKKKFN